MRPVTAAFVVALTLTAAPLAAQAPAPAPAAQPQATFPAQQRPPGDPELIEQGRSLYEVHCRFCHGMDLRGGDMGGPNLLRSSLVLNDQRGELIGSIIRNGSQTPGVGEMPPFNLSDRDIESLAEYLHAIQATMRGQGNPPEGPELELDVLVGDPVAGKAYFETNCASCHTEDAMRAVAARIDDDKELQNHWVRAGRARRPTGAETPTTVIVTDASGMTFEGELVRYDDFLVALRRADGTERSFTRRGGEPEVEIREPFRAHKELLARYTDRDIHDVTAFLASLR